MEKIKGISVIGRMDIMFNSLYGELGDTDAFTEYVLSRIRSLRTITANHRFDFRGNPRRKTRERDDISYM